MIRRPTPPEVAYAWHQRALADMSLGLDVEITDDPQPGWYQRRLVRGGVMVPARIFLDAEYDEETCELLAPEELACEIDGARVDAHEFWTWLAARPITEAEYNYMVARRNFASWHEPASPFANPKRPVDWLRAPVPEF